MYVIVFFFRNYSKYWLSLLLKIICSSKTSQFSISWFNLLHSIWILNPLYEINYYSTWLFFFQLWISCWHKRLLNNYILLLLKKTPTNPDISDLDLSSSVAFREKNMKVTSLIAFTKIQFQVKETFPKRNRICAVPVFLLKVIFYRCFCYKTSHKWLIRFYTHINRL